MVVWVILVWHLHQLHFGIDLSRSTFKRHGPKKTHNWLCVVKTNGSFEICGGITRVFSVISHFMEVVTR